LYSLNIVNFLAKIIFTYTKGDHQSIF